MKVLIVLGTFLLGTFAYAATGITLHSGSTGIWHVPNDVSSVSISTYDENGNVVATREMAVVPGMKFVVKAK